MFKKLKLWAILTPILAILTIIFIIANSIVGGYATVINAALGTSTSKVVKGDSDDEDTEYYKSDWDDRDALEAYEDELCQQLEAEGAALLKNDNNALPLSSGAKVSLFSQSSNDFMYGGTGSGAVDTASAATLSDACEAAGLSVNSTLRKFYKQAGYYRETPATTGGKSSDYKINEVPVSLYTESVKSSFSSYGDAAIVTLARSGGEGADLPYGDGVTGCESGCSDAIDGDYLRLNSDEIDMLNMIKSYKDSGAIKKVIILLNSSNCMQLDFLDDYGIDAVLWVGDVGQTGIYSVAKILTGEVNPSGRIVDTFLRDNHSSPSMANFGVYDYSNSTELSLDTPQNNTDSSITKMNSRYLVYLEGIYVGYRYYETRYEDYVMGNGNAGSYSYSNDVAYPFGYGLSYTNGGSYDYSDYKLTEKDDHFEISVKVTNNTGYDGKHTVQIYMQSPYTTYDVANGVEKASVELCGFDKQEIKAGASATYTITVDKSELASYDSNGAKTYIVDDGDYYFTAASDAHQAVNNILAAKGYTPDNTDGKMDTIGNSDLVGKYTQDTFDSTTYATSSSTGYEITNQFDNADLNKYTGANKTVTYLSRSDWTGTFPTAVTNFAVTEQMWHDGLAEDSDSVSYPGSSKTGADERQALIEEYKENFAANWSEEITEVPTMGSTATQYQLAMFIGEDYDNELWSTLLDQASYSEMINVIYNGFHLTKELPSIGMPDTKDENGPQGYTASITGGASAMCYTSEDVMAATFNLELVAQMGECIGEDCFAAGTAGLYGPGGNIHRTPYCGRNFEYYSEDGFLSGVIAAVEVEAIQSNGVYVFMKHCVLNDQENGRYGVSTYVGEQALREVYLRPFQGAIEDGGASGVMTSFNRIGVVWSGAHYGLMTEVLRNEWGMMGAAITDCSVFATPMDYRLGVLAGQNLWDGYSTNMAQLDGLEDDAIIVTAVRESVKRIAYSICNSLAMNGISSSDRIVSVTPWWQMSIYGVIALFAVLTIGSAGCLAVSVVEKKKNKN